MSSRASGDRRAFRFLSRLAPRLGPHRTRLVVATLLLLVSVAVGLAFPLVVRELLDAAFLAGDGSMLNRIALGLLALFAFQGVVNFGQSYLTASVSERVVADLRVDLFDRLVAQPPGFFDRTRVGTLSSRLASDAGLVQDVLRFGIPELARQGLFLVGALVLVTATNPRLTLVTLTAIPVAAAIGLWLGRRVGRLSTTIQDTLGEAVSRAEQVFTQIRTVQAFTREAWEAERFGDAVARTRDAGLSRAVHRAGLVGAVTFTAFGAIVAVLWEGGRLVLAGALTPGTLVAFLLYAVTIAGAITSLAGFWANLQEAGGATRRIFELVEAPRELSGPSDPVALPRPVEGRVVYRGVRFRYADDGPPVLDGVDLELAPGEAVALVGSSGAGKTTLASLLPRFYDVDDGAVLLDGVDVRRLALAELRGAIGLVPQEPMLFAGTIRENLLYGRPDASDEALDAALVAAHAAGFVGALPDGIDQVVGERGVTLSAGQRQRIAVARVFLEAPPVLILDEASSALDAESEALVQDALDRLVGGRTTLVIAHRLSTVLRADRIVVLDEGRVDDQGRHDELLERSDVYRRLVRRQLAPATPAATPETAPPPGGADASASEAVVHLGPEPADP